MLNALKDKIRELLDSSVEPLQDTVFTRTDHVAFMAGQVLSRIQDPEKITCLSEAEFKVFSQWGEDGIIQHLVRAASIEPRLFVEIGTENYWESNTRFLLMHNNWAGVVIDSSDGHRRFLDRSGLGWRHKIKAVTAFVTRENVNELLAGAGIGGAVGLLSLDIDGVDYWVLESLKNVSPAILVVEYNSRFGSQRAVTVPYRPDFDRLKAHYGNCYFGASLPAFVRWGNEHGYRFVGATSAGNNAFFVRDDIMPSGLRALSAEEGFVKSCCCESRTADGELAYLTEDEEKEIMKDLPVVDLDAGETVPLRDVFGAS